MNNRKGLFLGETQILSELCDSITDCHHSTPKWTDSGKLVIRNFNIKKGRLSLTDPSFTNDETYNERIKRKRPESGDLIITREAPMGEVCIIPDGLECCLGQRMVLLKPNKKRVLGSYLLYALQSEFVQTQIQKSDKTGSIVSNLRIPVLEQLNIPVFDTFTQEKIGSILQNIDSKIELNNRINAELEAMAKTLYDYWFVQFEFPIEAAIAAKMGDPNLIGQPFKTSGGKMVWNEELKREIPEGWEIESIEKCCSIIDCLHSKKSDLVYENQQSYLLQLNNILDNGLIDLTDKYYVTSAEYKKWTTRIEVIDGDIVITNAGRVAATAQIPMGVKAGIGRNITAIRPRSICHTYLFLSFQGADVKRQIKLNTDSGAFFTSFNVKGIKKLQLIRANKNLEEQFEKMVLPIRRRRELNNIENQKLTELRDWLLPMLMNGQVKVSER
jgi:type I restriction enzyme S subunit